MVSSLWNLSVKVTSFAYYKFGVQTFRVGPCYFDIKKFSNISEELLHEELLGKMH